MIPCSSKVLTSFHLFTIVTHAFAIVAKCSIMQAVSNLHPY